MFGISGTELIIILFFGFLIFGPEKLPQMGRTVGRAIRQFRDASEAANKKFKEQVADPFQDAIAPYKDQMEESTKPLQEDIAAINSTLNETKSMFTDPFKDIFTPAPKKPDGVEKAGAVISAGVAVDDAPAPSEASEVAQGVSEESSAQNDATATPSAHNDDPASPSAHATAPPAHAAAPSVILSERSESKDPLSAHNDDAEAAPAAPKKSLAASLYDLDEDGDGE